jgi:hypothetical protein
MDEVTPVMTKLAAGGIDVTALHNHLLRTSRSQCICTCSGTAIR